MRLIDSNDINIKIIKIIKSIDIFIENNTSFGVTDREEFNLVVKFFLILMKKLKRYISDENVDIRLLSIFVSRIKYFYDRIMLTNI